MEPVGNAAHRGAQLFDSPVSESEMIVFIGPQKRFSKTLLRNVEEECPEFQALRFDRLDELLSTDNEDVIQTRILIVDRFLCAESEDQLKTFAQDFKARHPHRQPPGIAVAYANGDEVKLLLNRFDRLFDLRGFIPMNTSIDIWLSIVRLLANGGKYFAPDVLLSLSNGVPQPELDRSELKPHAAAASESQILSRLTQRENDVIEHVSNGLQNKQIAALLDVSEHTVKLHMHHIITKLEVRNRTEAATKYLTLRPKG